jgi:hypothetical protein
VSRSRYQRSLKVPGLALVAVDGQVARAGIGAHEAPFLARDGKPGAAQPAQARGQDLFLHRLPVAARRAANSNTGALSQRPMQGARNTRTCAGFIPSDSA